MKSALFRSALLALAILPITLPATLFAATQEKNGVRLDVVPKTVGRNDGAAGYYREIDRTLTMKAVIKNVSFTDLAAGTISYTVILHRWGTSESGAFEIEAGSVDLKPLKRAEQIEVALGEFGISGHMHGQSKEHLDKLEGWQVVVESGDKKVIFESGSNFATLKKRAEKGN